MNHEEDPQLELAIAVMKTQMEKTDLRAATKSALIEDHGFDEEDAAHYAQLAFDWWLDAFYD